MQTNTIKRGQVVIGTISFENGVSALGSEVVATAVFPSPDGESGTDQFETYERAQRFLDCCYEAHCEAHGVTPEPGVPEAPEVDEEAAYHAREAARAQEEAAHYDAVMEREERIDRQRVLAQQDVLSEDERAELLQLAEFFAAEEEDEGLVIVEQRLVTVADQSSAIVNDGADDDLPF